MVDNDNVKKEFPFEFKDLEPEALAVIKNYFEYYFEMRRVGPMGFILSADYEADAGTIYNMPVRSDDVFVCSYPRSGTTWTQELVWLLVKDLDYAAARSTTLRERYTFLEFTSILTKRFTDRMIHINEIKGVETNVEHFKELNKSAAEILATCPSPRFIKSHLPMSFLPPNAIDTAKILYVARDPRDVVVSCFYLHKTLKFYNFKGDFKTFWDLFRRNLFPRNNYFEHLKIAWAFKNHPNMLFLFYEELSEDLPMTVRRVADFFGKQLSNLQIGTLCDHLSFENFKKNESVNYIDLEQLGLLNLKSYFIRKGKVGGWRDYFDAEMTAQAQRWIDDNLRDTDLRFPHL